jgi:uncharacterized phage-like protein YoqJ
MIYGVTGHRDVEQEPGELLMFARLSVAKMVERGATEIITGMARGWDLKVARAASDAGVPFIAAVPFPSQPNLWLPADQEDWARLIQQAARVEVISRLPLNDSFHKRNRWIVDQSVELWSFWNGQPGGTQHCTLYAGEVGRIVRPLWEPWTRFRAERT